MLDVERWKCCVVHLEAAADSADKDRREAALRKASGWLLSGGYPSDDEYAEGSQGLRDVRFRGTAIFVEHKSRHYLITARHVLTDEESARRDLAAAPAYLPRAEESIENWIFPIIFRVPSLDEILAAAPEKTAETERPVSAAPANVTGAYLELSRNIWSGAAQRSSYTFSDPSLDLAVISLEHQYSFFRELWNKGYRPIYLDRNVEDCPSGEGAEVVAVGYPDSVSVLGQMPLNARSRMWASAVVSLPVFSWGHVAMQHKELPFFWADLTIYPGNSGGPVIESQSNKLVGIVSCQATVEGARVPFARVINAGIIRGLLESQSRNDDQQALSNALTLPPHARSVDRPTVG